MPDSIGKFTPSAVIEAIENSLVDSSAALGRSDDGIVFRGTDVTWVYTGVPSVSRVLSARFNTEDAQDRASQILGYFKTLETPVSWVVGPSTYPPTLGDYLHNLGFGIYDTWIGMAMNLTRRAGAKIPRGFRVEEVSEKNGLADWAQLWADPNCQDRESAVNLFSPGNAGGHADCRYYLGYYQGSAVSRAMTYRRDGVVGLYWLATKNEFQGKGFRAALVARAMNDAVAEGASAMVMAVPSDSQRFSESLGFKAYCQFHVYNWPAVRPRQDVC